MVGPEKHEFDPKRRPDILDWFHALVYRVVGIPLKHIGESLGIKVKAETPPSDSSESSESDSPESNDSTE